jgi:phage portal protein BeeE
MSREFVTYTLDPWLARWEGNLRRTLLSPDEKKSYFFKFNVDGLLRGDYQSRMQGYAVGIQNGFMCPNDVRRLEDWDLIPESEGGNNFMVNGNMVPVRLAGAAYGATGDESNNANTPKY